MGFTCELVSHVALVHDHLAAGEPGVVPGRVGADPLGAVTGREHVLHREELGAERGHVEVGQDGAGDDVAGAGGEGRVGGGQGRQGELVGEVGDGLEGLVRAILDAAWGKGEVTVTLINSILSLNIRHAFLSNFSSHHSNRFFFVKLNEIIFLVRPTFIPL